MAGSEAVLPQGLSQQHLVLLGQQLPLCHRAPHSAAESPGTANPSPAAAAQPRPVALGPWGLQLLLSLWQPPSSFCCHLPSPPACLCWKAKPCHPGVESVGTRFPRDKSALGPAAVSEVLQSKCAPKTTTRGTDSRSLMRHHRAVTSGEGELRWGRTAPMTFVMDGDTASVGETNGEGEKWGMPCGISGQLREMEVLYGTGNKLGGSFCGGQL